LRAEPKKKKRRGHLTWREHPPHVCNSKKKLGGREGKKAALCKKKKAQRYRFGEKEGKWDEKKKKSTPNIISDEPYNKIEGTAFHIVIEGKSSRVIVLEGNAGRERIHREEKPLRAFIDVHAPRGGPGRTLLRGEEGWDPLKGRQKKTSS